ncbi:MAG: FtsX-like permease family protein [Anaerolineae bacterium]|nr:FtsX-like permease family protein [Anaerolineae bacterium]
MGVIRYKIWSDLWANKGRTLQVVLIIAIGAFAIGATIGGSDIMRAVMSKDWRATSPAMIVMAVNPEIDDEELTALKNVDGVEEVEGLLTTNIEWRLTPDEPWQAAGLMARDDYEEQKFNKLTLISGDWPNDKSFAMEKGNDSFFNIPLGGQIYIRVNDKERVVKVDGILSNRTVFPASMGGSAQFYTSRDYYGDLTGERDFNQVLASAAEYDPVKITEIADRLQRQLEKQDIETTGAALGSEPNARTADPNKHFLQDFLDGLFLVLSIMGGLILILGLFLVYNTINAVIAQQVNQIGIMKAIGANTRQILGIYLLTVFIYGFLALVVAVPLGALGAYGINVFMLTFFNIDPGPFQVSPRAILVQVAIALLAPLVASLIPVTNGSRITVREAISTYGLGGAVGLLDRLVARMKYVSRLVLLTLSNTFRNKWRVVLTQITLVGSGIIFMMVMSVRDSTTYTFTDLLFQILNFNVNLQFEDPERIGMIEKMTLAQPGVKAVEMWGFTAAKIRPANQPESDDDKSTTVFGVPLPTTLYGPQMRMGRWLQPGDTNVVVLNQKLAEDVGVGIGDWITLDHGLKGESNWQVVGLLFDPVINNSAHVPREPMLREIGEVGRASTLWVQTERTDAASESEVAQTLREFFDSRKIKVNAQSIFFDDTASDIIEGILFRFGIIISLLAAMAVIIAIVGSIGLSGVLSLSVLERRREIGVMRAIGASSGKISRLFIGEGLILGLLSWLIALPLSIPAGYAMTQAMGAALQTEIVYRYTPAGALYWLGIIVVLSIVASWFPARGATRISVRESLAYQ